MNLAGIIDAYFSGEKYESGWILLAGALALATALALWFLVRQPFARGLAAALLLAAVLGLVVGGTVYFRTEHQVAELHRLRAADPARFSAEEGARIGAVVRSFGQYRLAYAAAVVLALVLVFVFGRPVHQGIAVGLLVLAALGLTIDFYAGERAQEYRRGLVEAGAIAPP
jgi:integral membrane sensor domain MASE1